MSNFLSFQGNSGVTFKTFTASGGTTYTLDKSASTNSVLVSVGGVLQKPGTDYSVSGTTLTTTSTVVTGVEIDTYIIHDVGNAPSIEDNSIVTAKISDNQVNEAKLAISNSPTNGQFLSAQSGDAGGLTWATAGGGGLASQQVFTSSGTWTKPTGIKLVKVTVQGAGGGGGNGAHPDTNWGAGGSGGGTAIEVIDVSSISSETVTVGAGGTSGGGTGGTSSFGSHCSATGGTGGGDGTADRYGEDGGTGSGGDINLTGGQTGYIKRYNNGSYHSLPPAGNSFLGFGSSHHAVSGTASRAGIGYGGGGAGGYLSTSYTSGAGGVGAPGIVIVEEYK